MTERLFSELCASPAAPLSSLPGESGFTAPVDEHLLQMAAKNRRASSEGLRQLCAGVMSVRATLNRLLRERLDLDGQQVGLLFHPISGHAQRFISLTHAFAFVFQQPRLEEWLDRQCRVEGMDPTHALHPLAPLQLLERLKSLEPAKALEQHWNAYWNARATGTSQSRREHAGQLYRAHIEAVAQMAFARRQLTADQLKPLWALLDTTGKTLTTDRPSKIELPSLLHNNGVRTRLPAACVISSGDETAMQLLYLPGRPDALHAFARRSDLQAWLIRQPMLIGVGSRESLQVEFVATDGSLTTAFSQWLLQQQMAQAATLRHSPNGKRTLFDHAPSALNLADQFDRQSGLAMFSTAPGPGPEQSTPALTDEELPPLFDSLHADIPWSWRQAAVRHQRDLLEAWLAGTGRTISVLNELHRELEDAEKSADNAAHGLLDQDAATFDRHFTALHQAHKRGLHAEAELQGALGQLSNDESSLLKALLDSPAAAGVDQVAASLTLYMSAAVSECASDQTRELTGPFVLTHRATLLDPDSPHSVLLYWPGSIGLRRFANRRELEQQILKIGDSTSESGLRLIPIPGDPLRYSLEKLANAFKDQAVALRRHSPETPRATSLDEQLENLRKRSHADMQVPVNAARSLAIFHLSEQDHSAALITRLPDWLKRLDAAHRSQLKHLIEAFIVAMHRSHEMMSVSLIPRDDFTRQHLHARLREDFSLKGDFSVSFTFPDTVTEETRYSPGPGGVQRTTVLVPGNRYSRMSLEDLAQLNIDNKHSVLQDSLSQRLVFMRLDITSTQPYERHVLLHGITHTYLRKTLPDLDLPKAYEELIVDTFKGTPDDSLFVREHRRECLIEPWRLTLKLQGERARLQHKLGEDDLLILDIAIHASTPGDWCPPGKRVVILPAFLSAGGKDTYAEGPTTLSGVTFIEEQVSGVTLLYLPDSPNDSDLQRYASLEQARQALFRLCRQDEMARYLASRALQGDPRAHENRINVAVERHFDAMIGVGGRWPATTSLAAHLLDAHMGRLIEAHRSTSRSNAALFLERYALQGPRAFNYIKMALGFLPFIGTAIALYDAWTAANQAVAAFLRGQIGDGVAELGSVLLSLIDAAMDLIPGQSAASSLAPAARAMTRTRQLTSLAASAAALQIASRRQATHVVTRFSGYEYRRPLSLSGLQPQTHGIYRNIYRHPDGDFIVRQGRVFKVEWSKDSRNWRLAGTASKTYKQPIALDESGNWDTWFGVYGTTFEGGGLGGGGVLGHLADTLEPIWPEAIRTRLPPWWTNRALRRHVQLTETADELLKQLRNQYIRHDDTIARFRNDTSNEQLRELADQACISDIELASRRFQTLAELLPLTHGNKRREAIRFLSSSSRIIADRLRHRVYYSSYRTNELQSRIESLIRAFDELPQDATRRKLDILESTRKLRAEFILEVERCEVLKGELNQWYGRITTPSQKVEHGLKDDIDLFNQRMTDINRQFLKTIQRLELVKNYARADELSWIYLQRETHDPRAAVHRAMFVQYSLPQAEHTRLQRNQMLGDCLATYASFQQQMKAWTTRHPDYFHQEIVDPLLTGIEFLAEKARAAIDLPSVARPAGKSTKKVFITEDDRMLVGVEQWEPRTRKRQFRLSEESNDGEVWEQTDNGKFRLRNALPPQSPPRDLNRLMADARKRLAAQNAYLAKVRSYAEQDMLPVDLEHMMISEADDLLHRARDIEALGSREPVIRLLHEKAAELKTIGRQLRTRQALRSRQPTDGMLVDLLEQRAVDIRKRAALEPLRNRPDGRADYLQEYEIWNLAPNPPQLLWYAHFHYSKASSRFGEFEKAHLKLPEHRSLTHADNPDLPYADIGKRSAVLPYFQNV